METPQLLDPSRREAWSILCGCWGAHLLVQFDSFVKPQAASYASNAKLQRFSLWRWNTVQTGASQTFGVQFWAALEKKQPPTQCALVGIATIGPMKKTWRNDDKKPWYPWSTLKNWCTKLGPPFSYVVVSTQSEGYAPQMGCSSSTGVNNGEHFHLEVFEKTIGSLRYH